MNVFSLIAFVPSLMYDVMMAVISDENWYDRIDDLIILGALPFPNLNRKLIQAENVRAVISMNENYELLFANGKKRWKEKDIYFLQLPTADIFEAPSQDDLKRGVGFIKEFSKYIDLLDRKEPKPSIYIHCKSGKMRSATMVACYLMEKHGWDPEKAVHYIKSKRPQILLFRKHWTAIWDYYCNLKVADL